MHKGRRSGKDWVWGWSHFARRAEWASPWCLNGRPEGADTMSEAITITTDAYSWVPGDADWDVGVPEISDRDSVNAARDAQIAIRAKQRVGV